MSTDDRDTESSNPSKSFKVGEVDRLSGFFTPVWESKRRLRSESRPPSSSSGVPSSARSADKNSRPSTPPSAPPSRRTGGAASSGNASARSPSTPAAASPAESARGAAPLPPEPPTITPPTQREDGGGAVAHPTATRPVAPASAKALAPTNEASTSSSAAPAAAEEPELPAADAAEVRIGAGAHLAAALAAAAAVTVRPVIPMPSTPGRLPPRPKPPSTPPGAASAAPKQGGGPDLEPGELVHREPAFGEPPAAVPRRGSSPEVQRSARVTAAATSLHDRLKSKVPIDSVDTFARHRETESEREALQAAAARAALTPSDPYPGHVLRTLRRTIHLSTPLPDDVRQMIEKYRH